MKTKLLFIVTILFAIGVVRLYAPPPFTGTCVARPDYSTEETQCNNIPGGATTPCSNGVCRRLIYAGCHDCTNDSTAPCGYATPAPCTVTVERGTCGVFAGTFRVCTCGTWVAGLPDPAADLCAP
jgi:hypothetical protein